MGPRTSIRGNAAVARMRAIHLRPASMGPRTSIRGNCNRVVLINRPRVCQAQWGRALPSAETPSRPAPQRWGQWGRGLPSAETIPRGFVAVVRNQASMGPRTSIRGNLRYRLKRWSSRRFNGAADFHPRKLVEGRHPVGELSRRFNGAADFHPRKQHAFEVFSCQRLALPLASAGRQTVDWTKRTLVPNPQLHACQHLPAASGHRVFALTSTLAPAAKAAHRVSNPW